MSATLIAPLAAETLRRLHGWHKPAATPGATADCSLIIPTYRRPQPLLTLLEILVRLPDVPGEVVVVDGAPDDESERAVAAWARARHLPFELVYVKSPAGLTLQRNVGIDASRGNFVFFLDDDALPEPDYFRSIRQVFLDDTAGEIGAVRGFLLDSVHQSFTRLWRLRQALGVVPRGRPGSYHPAGVTMSWNLVAPFHGIRPVDFLAGCAAAYRREVLAQHRFSLFFSGYSWGEDLEMSRRIARNWKLVICGDARVRHCLAEGGRPAGWAAGRMSARNRHFIWKRHSPEAKVADRFKFWLDYALIILSHLASALRPPWRRAPLLYAWGTFCGAGECVFHPSRYEEPPARREFEFALEELAPGHSEA